MVPGKALAASVCVCVRMHTLLGHRSSPQKNREYAGLTVSEKPSLAGISAHVWMLCLCLAAIPAQESLAVGISALLFGCPWECVWAHMRLQPVRAADEYREVKVTAALALSEHCS